jgi:hypothetical protein
MALANWHKATASVRRIDGAVREKLRGLPPWMRSTFGEHSSLSYHTCRFCKRGRGEVPGLWKYGVRHYACDDCRDGIIGR